GDAEAAVPPERQGKGLTVLEDPLPVLTGLVLLERELREIEEEGGVSADPRLPGQRVEAAEQPLRVARVLRQELEQTVLELSGLVARDHRAPPRTGRMALASDTRASTLSSERGTSNATPTRQSPSRPRSDAMRTMRPATSHASSEERGPVRSRRIASRPASRGAPVVSRRIPLRLRSSGRASPASLASR